MLKRVAFWILLLAPLLATVAVAGGERFGAGVELQSSTPIRDILADPDAWVGRTVRVEGKVAGVCARKGCWLELESGEDDQLRVKVEDDVIVFPRGSEGRWAVAEGTVEVRELTREQYVGWLRHRSEEQGEAFDEASVGDAPYRLVQIKGTGAEIDGEPPAGD